MLARSWLRGSQRAWGVVQRRCLSAGAGPEAAEREQRMKALLTEHLKPTTLYVEDISGGCGAMYNVEIESPEFAGKSLVAQHRMVNQILAKEIAEIHGMQLKTRAPST